MGERGAASGMYGEQERCTQGFVGEPAEKETTGLGVGGRIILKMILKKHYGEGGMNRINVAGSRDRWPAVLNKLMNLWAPQNAGNFFFLLS